MYFNSKSNSIHSTIIIAIVLCAFGSALNTDKIDLSCRFDSKKVEQVVSYFESRDFIIDRGFMQLTNTPNETNAQNVGKGYGHYFWPASSKTASVCLPISDKERAEFPTDHEHIQKCDRKGFSSVFHLTEEQHILLIGCTPPEMAYFGFQHYIAYRKDSITGWRHVFASISDGINQQSIVTSSSNKTPFNGAFFLTVTGDIRGAIEVARYLTALKIPLQPSDQRMRSSHSLTNDISLNLLPLPHSLLPEGGSRIYYGTRENDDLFSIMGRFILGSKNADYNAYFDSIPIYALRLTPRTTEKRIIRLIPNPILKHKSSNGTDSEKSLRAAVSILLLRAARELEETGHIVWQNWITVQGERMFGNEWAGQCVGGWSHIWASKCYGNSRDISYHAMFPKLRLNYDDDLYVIGVHHHRTGRSSYSQVTLVDMDLQIGSIAVPLKDLEGSAMRYLRNSIAENEAPFLYVVKFSNHCGPKEAHCYAFNTKPSVAILPVVQSFANPPTGLGFDDDEAGAKPVFLVTRPADQRECGDNCTLLSRVLTSFNLPASPVAVDMLLVYAMGHEYMVIVFLTYLIACVLAASVLNFPNPLYIRDLEEKGGEVEYQDNEHIVDNDSHTHNEPENE